MPVTVTLVDPRAAFDNRDRHAVHETPLVRVDAPGRAATMTRFQVVAVTVRVATSKHFTLPLEAPARRLVTVTSSLSPLRVSRPLPGPAENHDAQEAPGQGPSLHSAAGAVRLSRMQTFGEHCDTSRLASWSAVSRSTRTPSRTSESVTRSLRPGPAGGHWSPGRLPVQSVPGPYPAAR